jgi:hypothetical protein
VGSAAQRLDGGELVVDGEHRDECAFKSERPADQKLVIRSSGRGVGTTTRGAPWRSGWRSGCTVIASAVTLTTVPVSPEPSKLWRRSKFRSRRRGRDVVLRARVLLATYHEMSRIIACFLLPSRRGRKVPQRRFPRGTESPS